jgi:hypothetical protein
MRRITSIITLLVTLCMLISLVVPVNVYAATSASLAGPSTVRAGDNITLAFKVNANGGKISGSEGEFSFNSSQVSLTGKPSNPPSSWKVDSGSKTFSAYDDSSTMNKYITANNATLFTASFKVSSSLQAGTKISISVINAKTSYNFVDTNLGTVTYSVTLAAPKSTNNNLKSLTVSNATISPAFSAGTTNYSTTVPFNVSSLNVKTETEDSRAKASISGNSLKVGNNTVVVAVTSESGAKKEYKINVTREQDPNYVAKSEAKLKSISLGIGIISPAFNPDKAFYVVYLPYEVKSLNASASTVDSKASVSGTGTKELVEGRNEIKLTVTAEDGKTTKDYLITVVRMPEYNGSNAVVPSGNTGAPQPSITPNVDPKPTITETPLESPPKVPVSNVPEGKSISIMGVILLCVVSLAIGGLSVVLFMKNKKHI